MGKASVFDALENMDATTVLSEVPAAGNTPTRRIKKQKHLLAALGTPLEADVSGISAISIESIESVESVASSSSIVLSEEDSFIPSPTPPSDDSFQPSENGPC